MSRRARRLAAVVVTIAAVAAVWNVAAPRPEGSGSADPASAATGTAPAATGPAPVPRPQQPNDAPAPVPTRSFAIPAPALGGLALDTPPGTRVDVWVAWGPRVTARPRVQRLVAGATLTEIRPPVADGPPTAILAVGARRVSDLFYGYRYGELAVVTRS
ncbi:MAG TPA: hypothetical protein VHJ34_01665 [Actinomycetota bacterium]|nr:hypothetical protein [Actinomycetota bacterium]